MEIHAAAMRANALYAPPVMLPGDFVGVVNVLLRERSALPAGALFAEFSCRVVLKPHDAHEVAFYRGRLLVSMGLISDYLSPIAYFNYVVFPFVMSCFEVAPPVDPVAAEYRFWTDCLNRYLTVIPLYVRRGSVNTLNEWRASVAAGRALMLRKPPLIEVMRLCHRFASLESK